MKIRQLPPVVVNRIAAGEVIERPAAAVKELVENAIDAGARHIEVALRDGGQALIAVADDGCGMTPAELALAVERHCTSKLPDDDVFRITALGFRGEALPSIGAVSRLRIVSRPAADADSAWEIVGRGRRSRAAPAPAAHPPGTRVEVRDLFFATPARLKFLKTARSERDQAVDTVRRLAMACPGDRLHRARRRRAGVAAAAARRRSREARLAALLGPRLRRQFGAGRRRRATASGLTGLIGLPTLNRGLPRDQYLVVNGRPVRDRLLVGAVRGAYHDVLAHDRHPVVALFLDGPPEEIDVNVHPAKAEVRFRDAALVRGLIVGALRHALAEAGQRSSTTVGAAALAAFRPEGGAARRDRAALRAAAGPAAVAVPPGLAEAGNGFLAPQAAAARRAGSGRGAARRRPGAAARHLHPGRDRRRHRAGRPARGA